MEKPNKPRVIEKTQQNRAKSSKIMNPDSLLKKFGILFGFTEGPDEGQMDTEAFTSGVPLPDFFLLMK